MTKWDSIHEILKDLWNSKWKESLQMDLSRSSWLMVWSGKRILWWHSFDSEFDFNLFGISGIPVELINHKMHNPAPTSRNVTPKQDLLDGKMAV